MCCTVTKLHVVISDFQGFVRVTLKPFVVSGTDMQKTHLFNSYFPGESGLAGYFPSLFVPNLFIVSGQAITFNILDTVLPGILRLLSCSFISLDPCRYLIPSLHFTCPNLVNLNHEADWSSPSSSLSCTLFFSFAVNLHFHLNSDLVKANMPKFQIWVECGKRQFLVDNLQYL